jgi:hypothetical protein
MLFIKQNEPAGLSLSQIAEATKLSIQNAYRYVKKLLAKNLIRKDEIGLYHLTPDALNAFSETTRVGAPSVAKKLFSTSPAKPISTSPMPVPAKPEQATNLHALQIHYLIYPTSYSRIEAALNALHISFKRTGNPKHPTYTLAWQGLSLRIGSKHLIAWGPSLTEPINITAEQITNKAIAINIEKVMDFLRQTNIRIQETLDHKPILHIAYKELAIVHNDAAEQYAKKHHYLPLAYDKETDKATIWLDGTPAPGAFETNKDKNHEELRQWAQAIEDNIMHPYSDELLHRDNEARIWNALEQVSFTLKEYGVQLNKHIPVLEKMDKVLELDIKLKEAQLRRLNKHAGADVKSQQKLNVE